jgi:hypothetical protein
MLSPAIIEPYNEFKLLSRADIHEALHERRGGNVITQEIDRLVLGYCENFVHRAISRSSPVSTFLDFQPRWPIEAVAAQRTRMILVEALMTGCIHNTKMFPGIR